MPVRSLLHHVHAALAALATLLLLSTTPPSLSPPNSLSPNPYTVNSRAALSPSGNTPLSPRPLFVVAAQATATATPCADPTSSSTSFSSVSSLEAQLVALRKEQAQIQAAIATTAATTAAATASATSAAAATGGMASSPATPYLQQQNPPHPQTHSHLVAAEQQVRLALAVVLQQLNHLKPDGGSRLPEAEAHYRAVLASLPLPATAATNPGAAPGGPVPPLGGPSPPPLELLLPRATLRSNLVALLLEADRAGEALREVEAGLEEAHEALSSATTATSAAAAAEALCTLRFNRAKALAVLGRTAEAETTYGEAAVGAVGLDAGCFARATAAMTRLPDDLLPLVQSAVRQAEDNGLTRTLLSSSGSGSGDGSAGGDGSGGWLTGLGPSELSWLYFATAKALDERQAPTEDVWRLLEQANALQAVHQPYDADHDWRQLRTLTAVFNGQLLAGMAAAGGGLVGERSPVFVVGMPRSGSTLVETMLSAAPGVWAAGEDTALAPLTPHINNWMMSQGLHPLSKLADFGRRYVTEMRRRAAVSSGWGPGPPPTRMVDKMLKNLWLLGYIHLLLPDACLVHVVRHPLDVALSCFAQPFGYAGMSWSWRLADGIGEQLRMAAALAEHWAGALPPGRLLTLHYEELVAFPEVTARRLLSHCGIPWHSGVMDFHTSSRTVATASMAQVRQPLYNKSVGRWRKYETQLAPLASALRPQIEAYEAQLAAALRVAEAENRRLQEVRETERSSAAVADGRAGGRAGDKGEAETLAAEANAAVEGIEVGTDGVERSREGGEEEGLDRDEL